MKNLQKIVISFSLYFFVRKFIKKMTYSRTHDIFNDLNKSRLIKAILQITFFNKKIINKRLSFKNVCG